MKRGLFVHFQFQVIVGGVEVYRPLLLTVKMGHDLVFGTVSAALIDIAGVEEYGFVVYHISTDSRFCRSVSLVARNEDFHHTARIVARIVVEREDAQERLGVVLAGMSRVAIVLTVYDSKWQHPLVAHVNAVEVELHIEQSDAFP